MKKVVLLLALISGVISYAQEDNLEKLTVNKSTWMLGGTLGFKNRVYKNNVDAYNEKTHFQQYVITPTIGYAINNNLITGVKLGYSKVSNEREEYGDITSKSKDDTYEIAPFVRKFFPLGKKLALFGDAQVGYSLTKTKYPYLGAEDIVSEIKNWSFGLNPGLTYFVSKQLAFETSIGLISYTVSKNDRSDENTSTTEIERQNFDFNLNPNNLVFGLFYYF